MTKQQFNDLSDKYLNGSASADEEKILFAWYEVLQKKQVKVSTVSAAEKDSLFRRLVALADKEAIVPSLTEDCIIKKTAPVVKAKDINRYSLSKRIKKIFDVFHVGERHAYRKEGDRK